jgi:RHS repeat-associated protein
VASYEYTLDGNGMQTSVTMADGTASNTLDSLYRLTREDVDSASLGTFSMDYAYDAAGNRLDPGATYGQDNRLLTDAHGTYGYDGNGNVISRGAEAFGYDSDKRLTSYSNGTTTAYYEYDYAGRRVTRTVDGDITEYFYDGQNIVAEYLNGIQVARYTHGLGIDQPLMVVRNGETYFLHMDGLGSVVAITDDAGQLVQRYGYDAWSNIVYSDGLFSFSGSGLVNTLTYTGREYDAESGIYHYRARAYDPTLGRFLQKDPLQGMLTWPQTQNLYSYALNNPLYFTDPTGQVAAVEYIVVTIKRMTFEKWVLFAICIKNALIPYIINKLTGDHIPYDFGLVGGFFGSGD